MIETSGDGPYRVGQSVSIQGQYWTDECNDTIVCTRGCGGTTCTGGGRATPATNISIALVRGVDGAHVVLVRDIDASAELTFDVTIKLPPVAPGRYRFVAESPATGKWPGPVFKIVGR